MVGTARLSLAHLIREPRVPAAGRAPLLLLLHGVGSHERDLFQLAPALDPRFFIVSARGPLVLAPGAFAWFHVTFTPRGPAIVAAEAEASRERLRAFLAELAVAYPVDPQRVYLLGFSQGAIMSFSVALTAPERVAGVVALSGRILPEIRPLIAPPAALAGLPFLVIHGTEDTVLPVSYGRAARDLLAGLPVALTYREYPMGHQITADSLSTVAAWLTAQLDAAELPATVD